MGDADLNSENYLMLKEGMVLATDVKNVDTIQETLAADTASYTQKKQLEIDVFTEAGGFSPTLGIIGTVMGLVQVLSRMSDAKALAASIASAFIATLYGIFFANVVYLPAANHLKELPETPAHFPRHDYGWRLHAGKRRKFAQYRE